jgi:hypothetical protein
MSIRTWNFLLLDWRESGTICAVNLMVKIVSSLYDFLDVGKSPRPADCIFVIAGKEEQKDYGVKMWRFGYAAQLILSADGAFFRLDRQDEVSTPVKKGFFKMHTQARELARYMRELPVRSMLLVSSPANLRRAALVFGRAFRKSRIQLTFVAVPERPSFASPAFRSRIWSEFGKYLLYKFLPL